MFIKSFVIKTRDLFLIVFLLSVNFSFSQLYETGISYGKSNFIGDVGETTFVNPTDDAYGIIFKWNRSPRHSYRFSYFKSKLSANDLESKDPRRIERAYNFNTPINEFSMGMEFNFFDFDLHDKNTLFSPYLFSGLVYTSIQEQLLINDQIQTLNKSKSFFGLPMLVGFKNRMYNNLIFFIEIGARYTFTDEIDGNFNRENDFNFGNLNNNDWYLFSNFGVTYTFGKNPCYCNIGK